MWFILSCRWGGGGGRGGGKKDIWVLVVGCVVVSDGGVSICWLLSRVC